MSSARVTKKVKSRSMDDCETVSSMDEEGDSTESRSFKEALLSIQGSSDGEVFLEEEWVDEEVAEDRWYKEEVSFEDKKVGGILEIKVSDEEMLKWSEQWQKTLIVNVLGKKVNYRALEFKLNRDWARDGKIKIIDMPRGFYAVQFEKDSDYEHALFQGPWMIADHYILVQTWRRNFLRSARVAQKVAVWVRVPELPLELYNDIFLKRLGASLGTMLKIDRLTSVHSRGQFARLCVEIDLAKPVVPQVMVRGETLNLEYEGLHTICFHCGVYGHRERECLLKMKTHGNPLNGVRDPEGGGVKNGVVQKVPTVSSRGEAMSPDASAKQVVGCEDMRVETEVAMETELSVEEGDKPCYGPWIVVSRSNRKMKKVKAKGMGQSGVDGGERYVVVSPPEGYVNRSEGSRLEKSGHVVTKEVGSSGLTNQEKGNIKKGGELKVIPEKQIGPNGPSSPNPLKARNFVGGENTQLGHRIKDLKRAARNGNRLKKLGVAKSPSLKGASFKENINPGFLANLGAALLNGPDTAKDKLALDTSDRSAGPIKKLTTGNLSKISELPLVKELFGNPLLGSVRIVSNTGGDGLDKEVSKTGHALMQVDNELSEQNAKSVSK